MDSHMGCSVRCTKIESIAATQASLLCLAFRLQSARYALPWAESLSAHASKVPRPIKHHSLYLVSMLPARYLKASAAASPHARF